jgi:cellobiose-specific phosphotransferase system component IIB
MRQRSALWKRKLLRDKIKKDAESLYSGTIVVIPAKAGIQGYLKTVDACLHGNDLKSAKSTFQQPVSELQVVQIDEEAEQWHYRIL